MFDSRFDLFFAAVAAGVGLTLLGAAQLLMTRGKGWLFGLAAVGYVAAIGAVTNSALFAGRTAGFMLLGVIPQFLLGSDRFSRFFVAAWHGIRRLQIAGVTTMFVGLIIVGGSVWKMNADENEEIDRDTIFLESQPYKPMTEQSMRIAALTDAGTELPLQVADRRTQAQLDFAEGKVLALLPQKHSLIRTGPASDDSNCHGWVFTDGKYSVKDETVEKILAENHYQVVSDVRPGDLAIYRDKGKISHTALVRYVTLGMPVIVESKWSWMGVFLHASDQSIYGNNITYYRTPRANHTLAYIEPGSDAWDFFAE